MSKGYKVRNGLKYMPVKQYNPNGTVRATEIVVTKTIEPDTTNEVHRPSKWTRFKQFMGKLGRGAAYAISH